MLGAGNRIDNAEKVGEMGAESGDFCRLSVPRKESTLAGSLTYLVISSLSLLKYLDLAIAA